MFCNYIYLVTSTKCKIPESLLDLTLWQFSAPRNVWLASTEQALTNTPNQLGWALVPSSSAQSPGDGGPDATFTVPSGFLTHWVVRLIQHGLAFVNTCWLFPITFFSFLCLGACAGRSLKQTRARPSCAADWSPPHSNLSLSIKAWKILVKTEKAMSASALPVFAVTKSPASFSSGPHFPSSAFYY